MSASLDIRTVAAASAATVTPAMVAPLLSVRGIGKSFGGVRALKGVDLDIRAGEVHGLVGANGAGKSTLIRLLAGVELPDDGTIEVDGVATAIPSPQRASALGLGFIHQELNLVPHFSAIENMTLGLAKPARGGLIDWPKVRAEAAGVVERLGIDFPLDTPTSALSVAEQWMLSIGRALIRDARLIAMDEPTASLSAEESDRLFRVIRELARGGMAVLYVSHRLEEILQLCDVVTVFKDGERVAVMERRDMTRSALVRGIVGEDLAHTIDEHPTAHDTGPVVLELDRLGRGHKVKDVSLRLRSGEVLGLAGLVGAGRTELARLIFGVDAPERGGMRLGGRPYAPRAPYDAVERGVVLVPEERRASGVVLDESLRFNLDLPNLPPVRTLPWLPFVSDRKSGARAEAIMARLQIKAENADTRVRQLSGGNQQKVVIGKWLTLQTKVLILDEPSRGVDVGARAEIHRIIRELAAQGAAVLVISSDNEELPGLCDRVLVMVEGSLAGELRGDHISKERILQLSYRHDA
jgi:ribose transport system ATP-binding protein